MTTNNEECCCGGDCGCEENKVSQETHELTPDQLIHLEKIINIDELLDNSVIILTIEELSVATYTAVQKLMSLYGDKLKDKKCSLLVLHGKNTVETLSEKEMEKAGWVKKSKNLIIH